MSDDNLPAVLDEIGSIQQTMRSSPASYFKNEPLQQRYRHLLARKSGDSSILTDNNPAAFVPILTLKDFVAQGHDAASYSTYLKVSREAADWVHAMPEGDRRKFVSSIEALPQEVGIAAIQEIMARPPMVDPASARGVAAFADMPEGKVLIREWGHKSAHNLALVRERLFRVIDRVSERSATSFAAWLDGLSTGCAVALYRKLAA